MEGAGEKNKNAYVRTKREVLGEGDPVPREEKRSKKPRMMQSPSYYKRVGRFGGRGARVEQTLWNCIHTGGEPHKAPQWKEGCALSS